MATDLLDLNVNLALSRADVLSIANRFLESMTPEVARLPQAYRPQHIATAADIFYWDYVLDSDNVTFPGAFAETALVGDLSAFFSHAAGRLRALHSWRGGARSALY